MLSASRVPQSVAVITVAANLDIDAWTDLHGDLRLVGSLNPARQPPLPDRVVQIHYAGGRDRLVPAEIIRRGIAGRGRLRGRARVRPRVLLGVALAPDAEQGAGRDLV